MELRRIYFKLWRNDSNICQNALLSLAAEGRSDSDTVVIGLAQRTQNARSACLRVVPEALKVLSNILCVAHARWT